MNSNPVAAAAFHRPIRMLRMLRMLPILPVLGWAVVGCLGLVVGCSSSDGSEDGEPASFDTAASPTGGASAGAADKPDDDAFTTGESEEPPAATSGESGDADGSTSDGSGGVPPMPGALAGCPAPLPEDWIFCEDFESGRDPAEVFFDYHDADGAFVLSGVGGSSGLYAMQADYRPGVEGAGFLSIAFGENPVAAVNRPDYGRGTVFEDVYWRFRLRTEAGWPDVGPGQLTQITALAGADWGQAMVASLASDGSGTALVGQAETCVVGSTVPCQGYEDSEQLAPLAVLAGNTEVFSVERSGEWQCIEARVRLNEPGVPNGAFEFWVDGALEAGREDVDWRGTWSEYGLNLISIENFWPGGPAVPISRWVDDIVVSTMPIGCD